MKEKVIWKYELKIIDFQEIEMPNGHILSVQIQNGKPYLWALVYPNSKKRKIELLTIGTGHPIIDVRNLNKDKYIGTYQVIDDTFALVYHVFYQLN